MALTIKANSSAELIAAIDRLEKRSDKCYEGLGLLTHEWNYAAWLSLAECARRLESYVSPQQYGSGHHKIIVMNLARASAQMCKFARKYGRNQTRAASGFRWSSRVAKEVSAAFEVSWEYSMFCVDFPAWHKNLYAAEIVSADTIHFHAGTSELDRRVSAYQKGLRPIISRNEQQNQETFLPTQELKELFNEAIQRSKSRGIYGVEFLNIDQIRMRLAHLYAEKLSEAFRRYPEISLGNYTLGHFRNFYAGLLALAGAHEHLCFLWTRLTNRQPLESINLLYPRSRWIKLLAQYSGLEAAIVDKILPDLTFHDSQVQDLQVMPFVPLAEDGSLLAVAPAFPLASNWEENILRVCSYLRPKLYSATSLTKEDEMRAQERTHWLTETPNGTIQFRERCT